MSLEGWVKMKAEIAAANAANANQIKHQNIKNDS